MIGEDATSTAISEETTTATAETSTPPETEPQTETTGDQDEGTPALAEAAASNDDENSEGEEGAKVPKEPKPPKPPKKLKFKVDGEEREFTEEEVATRVNQAELHHKWNEKIRLAGEESKKAESLKASAERIVRGLEAKGPQVLQDLLTAKYGDPERAQGEVVRMLEAYLQPIYEEMEMPPAQREALKARREAEKYRAEAERATKEKQDREAREAEDRTQGETRQREIAFENQIVQELAGLKVPNDEITESIYRKARALADEQGTQLTAKQFAGMITQRRKALGLDKPIVAPAQVATPSQTEPEADRESEKTTEKVRLENLAKAREKLAQTRKPDKPQSPGFPRAKRVLTTDDVREKLGID